MSDWPQYRVSSITSADFPEGLSHAWKFSTARIQRLRIAIAAADMSPSVACIGVSGSLARMEAHPESDVDLLIVIDDRNQSDCSSPEQVYSTVWDTLNLALDDADLVRPKPGGVFSCCARWSQLSDQSARGIVNENMTTYGQRMQLLLDCQPIYQDSVFETLQRSLLSWYSETRIAYAFRESGPYHWLWQEVQRYWRSIRARACWLHANDDTRSLEVNVKLRSSRLLLIVAFLVAIESAHEQADGPAGTDNVFPAILKQTPLERIHGQLEAASFLDIAHAYEIAWKFCTVRPRQSVLTAEVLQALDCLQQGVTDMKKRQAGNWLV